MANGPGVSIDQLPNGKWRVRWNEYVLQDGKRVRKQPERHVQDEATAIALQAKVLRAMELGEVYRESPPVEAQRAATVDDVLGGWLRDQIAYGLAASTIVSNGASIKRILRAYRSVFNVPETKAVPGYLLNREAINRIKIAMAEGIDPPPAAPKGKGTRPIKRVVSDGTRGKTIDVLVAAWVWAGDDPEAYPGISPAPRVTKKLRVRKTNYAAPPHPTMAECDAMLRELAKRPKVRNLALPAAIIARCTGLRISQVLGIGTDDVDLEKRTIVVRIGKTEGEKVAPRTIPYAEALHPHLVAQVARAKKSGTMWPRRKDAEVEDSQRGPDRTLSKCWEACTARGEVRREVWDPPDREISRPDHALRAAVQGVLTERGVRKDVVDVMVGHGLVSVRDRHYVDPAIAHFDAMCEGVKFIPPIDWKGPSARSS